MNQLLGFIRVLLIFVLVPAQIDLLLMCLMPKPDLSDRTIGIFSTLLRMISRWFRRRYGVKWQDQQPQLGYYGISAQHSITTGLWRHAAFSEWCVSHGRCAVTFLVDIAKAFENIRHRYLHSQAVRWEFNGVLFAWFLRTYQSPRRLTLMGTLTQQVVATCSVVAGDGMADLMMRMTVQGLSLIHI